MGAMKALKAAAETAALVALVCACALTVAVLAPIEIVRAKMRGEFKSR